MAHTDLSIVIASCTDDPRKLNKTYSGGITASCYVKEPCDLYKPAFILDYNSSYLGKNYIYVSAWGRYYFIDDIKMDVGGKCVISATEDVLMSFKSQILNINATIVRAGDLNQAVRALSRKGDAPWKRMNGVHLDFTGRVRYI